MTNLGSILRWDAILKLGAIQGDSWGLFFIISLYFIIFVVFIPLYFIKNKGVIPLYFVKNKGVIPLYFIKKLYLCMQMCCISSAI